MSELKRMNKLNQAVAFVVMAAVLVAAIEAIAFIPSYGPPSPAGASLRSADFVTIILTAVAVMLAALAIILALAGVVGYAQIKSEAVKSATENAVKRVDEILPRQVQMAVEQMRDQSSIDGEAIANASNDHAPSSAGEA